MRSALRIGLFALAVVPGLAALVKPSLTGASGSRSPGAFVAINEAPNMTWSIGLYSPATGVLDRHLGSIPERTFTSNGLALAPDASAVYFTSIPDHPRKRFYLRLMRLDVASRRQTFMADGAQPAISADGGELAYAAFPHGLAVRDLATGHTRTIGLEAYLGHQSELVDASIAWLGDGSDVAVVPSAPAWDLVGRPPPPAHWCGTTDIHPVVVFVHVPAPPEPLTATCARLGDAQLGPPAVLGGSQAKPLSLTAAVEQRGSMDIELISQTGAITPISKTRDSLPLAFDPTGAHIMYLVGHNPPVLWEATIAEGEPIDRVRLRGRGWDDIAW